MKGRGFWATGGAIGAAILGSSCCLLPLLLMTVGSGTAAASFAGFAESFRAVIVIGSLLLLGTAAYFTYFRMSAGEC